VVAQQQLLLIFVMAATSIYNKFLQTLTASLLNLQSGAVTYGVALVGSGYTFDPTHAGISDITDELTDPSYSRKATTLASYATLSGGAGMTFTWNSVGWSGLTSVIGIAGAVLYTYTDVNDSSTYKLLAYFSLSDLPAAFTNINYTVQFPTAVKIYGS
jgi:hypothetical protein